MRQFAISDIHGCYQSFLALLDKIAFSTQDELYLLGDFTDRGPDSKSVIDHIWKLQNEGYSIFCLRGNHDQMMLNARKNEFDQPLWLKHGGRETLASFDAFTIYGIPEKYFDFLNGLPYYYEASGYIMVHAGLDFNQADPLDHPASMMWIRPWNMPLSEEWLDGRIVIHGHTPAKKEEIYIQQKKLKKRPALGIDAGCVFPHLGSLCAFELGSQELYFQPYVG